MYDVNILWLIIIYFAGVNSLTLVKKTLYDGHPECCSGALYLWQHVGHPLQLFRCAASKNKQYIQKQTVKRKEQTVYSHFFLLHVFLTSENFSSHPVIKSNPRQITRQIITTLTISLFTNILFCFRIMTPECFCLIQN